MSAITEQPPAAGWAGYNNPAGLDPQVDTRYEYGYGQPQHGHIGQPAQIPMAMTSWAPTVSSIPGVPPGLEYLTQVNQLVIKQIVELIEVLTGWETNNKYRVLNSMGQQVYYAAEETNMLMRQCCGPARGFSIHITDNLGKEVIKVSREFKCGAGCCWCASCDRCAFELQVEAPPGEVVGYVRQEQSGWKPVFSVRDANHEVMARIEGPCCVCNAPCCGDVEFPVYGADGTTPIGKVSKQWTGVVTELLTDADTFSVSFPQDMDVRMKATMFGAVFLIDFMYFEESQNNN